VSAAHRRQIKLGQTVYVVEGAHVLEGVVWSAAPPSGWFVLVAGRATRYMPRKVHETREAAARAIEFGKA